MHQPMYRLGGERVAFQPWVRLHGVRAYYDMVRVLEEFPRVRVTFNMVPTLLDQVRAYVAGASDAFREVARVPAADLDDAQRRFVVDHFFSAQEERLIRPLPRYRELLERRRAGRRSHGLASAWREFSTADLQDLQALFDLAWFGFKAEEEHAEIRDLRKKQRGYTPADVEVIHRLQDTILAALLPLYRAAAARGQAEISASPYAHPILPLLIDTASALEAMPGVTLPPRLQAGEDAARQIREGLVRVGREFGAVPRGMWPSEGSISDAAVSLMAESGVAWAASDVDVLRASRRQGDADPCRPWRLEGAAGGLDLIFRDHELSDRIGFTCARAEPVAAVADLLGEARRRAGDAPGAFVLVALDGENPWEHYEGGGAAFLRALYGALERGEGAAACTVSDVIRACPRRGALRSLRAGSWINADFGTWIGGPEKNRAWTLLGQVRQGLAARLRDPKTDDAARRIGWESLRSAEGSDWFWWLDGQFDSLYRPDFDRLLRSHLRLACEALGQPIPDDLDRSVLSPDQRAGTRTGSGPPSLPEVVVDGYESGYYEWYGAEVIESHTLVDGGAMLRAERPFEALRFGFSPRGEFCLRLDPAERATAAVPFAGLAIELRFSRNGEAGSAVTAELDAQGDVRSAHPASVRARARKLFEMSVPAVEAGISPGASMILFARVRIAGETLVLREIELWRGDWARDAPVLWKA